MALANVKHVVLVLSGKGGVGKSSITTQLALSLTLQGHNVGILDVDLTGPSIPRLLGIEDSKVKQAAGGWLPVPVHEAQKLDLSEEENRASSDASLGGNKSNGHKSKIDSESDQNAAAAAAAAASAPHVSPTQVTIGSLRAMSLAFLLASRSTAIVWRGPKKTAMIRQFLSTTSWPEGTDYLLVDTPPGTSDEHISLVETLLKQINDADGEGNATSPVPNLAGAVIVTTPQAVAVSDVRKELNFCAKTGVKVIGVVENMSGYVCPCCGDITNLFSKGGGKIMADEFRVPFLGSVPVDPLWGVLVETGKRPKYHQEVADQVAAVDGDDEKSDDESDNVLEPTEGASSGPDLPRIMEPGLLVDKYRDCSLARAFGEIATQVVTRSEQGSAVVAGRA